MKVTRRTFLAAVPLAAQTAQQRIDSVRAWVMPLLSTARFGTAEFKGDFDPARNRWFGPFSQLAGSILVEIKTTGGLIGYGLGGGGSAGVHVIETHLRDLLLGTDPSNIELLWEQMYNSTLFYGRKGLAIQAISGVDLALWDLAGKTAKQPVYKLLGGATKDKVAVYLTSKDVELGLKRGIRSFKLPVDSLPYEGKAGMDAVVAQVENARKAIGPQNDLMIDTLCRWNVPYTLEMADRLAPSRLRFIEEPLNPDDMAGYAQLCTEIKSTKIASGEHEYTRYGFENLITRRAAHILQPDITWSGGLTELRKIAALASAHQLPLIPHRGGSAFCLHFILATAHCDLAESFGVGEPGNEIMETMSPRFADGFVYPNDKPGFGVELTEALIRKHAKKN
ncbi:MAG TPA: enolase C-terminal domain-like protein [Bryobacteraceae bacterium]|nr:enolase C-terminal domain-like protein [Bryobacteraceae bacterium]